jgi:hypothetical protein
MPPSSSVVWLESLEGLADPKVCARCVGQNPPLTPS